MKTPVGKEKEDGSGGSLLGEGISLILRDHLALDGNLAAGTGEFQGI